MNSLDQSGVLAPARNSPGWNRPHPFRRLLHVPDSASDLRARGVVVIDEARALALQDVALHFLSGCNAMFADRPLERLERALAASLPKMRGFVAEGAGMGAVIRDALSIRGDLFEALLWRHHRAFEYMIAVGAGWGLARVPWRRTVVTRQIDPVVAALVWDGRGFHDFYFRPATALAARKLGMKDVAHRAYDCGLGRALWFIASGSPVDAARLLLTCPASRQDDLAAGLGLAMAYAGPCTEDDWRAVLNLLPGFEPALAQGVCFAAEAHRRNACQPETVQISAIACGLSAEEAAEIAARTRPRIAIRTGIAFAEFHEWRRAIRDAIVQVQGVP